jgi:hypothetical protein
MIWSSRYAKELNFEDMVRESIQSEAKEKMNHHDAMIGHHENGMDFAASGSHEQMAHAFAGQAHGLAFEAWNHVWNHSETPNEQYPEYNAQMDHSLRQHARSLSAHADSLTNWVDNLD